MGENDGMGTAPFTNQTAVTPVKRQGFSVIKKLWLGTMSAQLSFCDYSIHILPDVLLCVGKDIEGTHHLHHLYAYWQLLSDGKVRLRSLRFLPL